MAMMIDGQGEMARKPRKGGSAAAVPGQMTNTAMPGTQQLSQVPGGGVITPQLPPGMDASGMQGGAIDNPMGSGAPGAFKPGAFGQDPGMAGSLGEQPMGTPLQKPGKGGGAASIPSTLGGGIRAPGERRMPGLPGMIRNRVMALRGRGGMGGGGY
jgi:hypothetical protein